VRRCLPILGFLLVLGSAASAQCPPVPAASICSIGWIDADVCPTPAPPTLVWCPAGDLSRIVIRVRALGAAGAPCAGCPLTITARFRGRPTLTGTNLWVCGAVASVLTATVTTDANGVAVLPITGGGCGCLIVDYIVDATACGGPPVLCSGTAPFCVKSPDITGNGIVNFQDTFRYAPMLAAGFGYCGDFNCNGAVNFADTFQYAPHLAAVHACTFGSTVTISTDCTLPCM
jgi:hypothetical protein